MLNKPHPDWSLVMKSKHFPDNFYRVSVKGLCVQDGKILLVKESANLSGKWELPGGGLDFGEDPRTGLEREVEEEMGLDVVSVSEQPVYVWTARFENRRDMDWYYSVVLGYQVTFADLHFTPTDECEDIAFFSKQELQSLDIFHQSAKLRDIFNPSHFAAH